MTQQPVGYEDSDISLQSGRLRVRRWGAADAPAVVCVPGLSANLCGFDRLAERLAGDALQLVAIDLRGRGRSEVTGAGTYGWRNHARDVLAVADAVGAPSFAVIGQSSGAAIAMTCAQLEPSRVERLVLVDLAGSPDERAAVPVAASVSRLGAVYPSAQAAIALIKQIGIVPEWDEYWDRYFGYELRDVDGGVTARSDRGAVLEDLGYGNAMYWPGPDAPVHALWTAITMPALVLRARQEITPGFGFILPAVEAERFAAAVPSARVVEIDANHYTITTHDDSIAAIGAFLERQVQTPKIQRTLPVPTVTVGLGWPEWTAWDQRRRGGRLLRRRRRRDRHPPAPPRARHRATSCGSPTGRPGTAIAAAEGKVPRLVTWVICSRSRGSGR